MARDIAAILYTSLEREGALAEIAFHWSQLNPRPTKPVLVHRLRVVAHRHVNRLGPSQHHACVHGPVRRPQHQQWVTVAQQRRDRRQVAHG